MTTHILRSGRSITSEITYPPIGRDATSQSTYWHASETASEVDSIDLSPAAKSLRPSKKPVGAKGSKKKRQRLNIVLSGDALRFIQDENNREPRRSAREIITSLRERFPEIRKYGDALKRSKIESIIYQGLGRPNHLPIDVDVPEEQADEIELLRDAGCKPRGIFNRFDQRDYSVPFLSRARLHYDYDQLQFKAGRCYDARAIAKVARVMRPPRQVKAEAPQGASPTSTTSNYMPPRSPVSDLDISPSYFDDVDLFHKDYQSTTEHPAQALTLQRTLDKYEITEATLKFEY